jgi:hypothetical protein
MANIPDFKLDIAKEKPDVNSEKRKTNNIATINIIAYKTIIFLIIFS